MTIALRRQASRRVASMPKRGHPRVHQDHVRVEAQQQRDRLLRVAGLPTTSMSDWVRRIETGRHAKTWSSTTTTLVIRRPPRPAPGPAAGPSPRCEGREAGAWRPRRTSRPGGDRRPAVRRRSPRARASRAGHGRRRVLLRRGDGSPDDGRVDDLDHDLVVSMPIRARSRRGVRSTLVRAPGARRSRAGSRARSLRLGATRDRSSGARRRAAWRNCSTSWDSRQAGSGRSASSARTQHPSGAQLGHARRRLGARSVRAQGASRSAPSAPPTCTVIRPRVRHTSCISARSACSARITARSPSGCGRAPDGPRAPLGRRGGAAPADQPGHATVPGRRRCRQAAAARGPRAASSTGRPARPAGRGARCRASGTSRSRSGPSSPEEDGVRDEEAGQRPRRASRPARPRGATPPGQGRGHRSTSGTQRHRTGLVAVVDRAVQLDLRDHDEGRRQAASSRPREVGPLATGHRASVGAQGPRRRRS